jgi:hypothetical protein
MCAVKRPPLVDGLSYVATGVYSTFIYTLDAYPYTSFPATQKYDTQSDTWVCTTRIPTPRATQLGSYGAFAATLGDKIHVIGGGSLNPTKIKNEVYSPVMDSWTSKVSVPTGYNGGFVGAWDAAIIVGGGSSVHKYAQAIDAWTAGTRLPSAAVACLSEPVQPSGFAAKRAPSSTLVLSSGSVKVNVLYVVGGWVPATNVYYGTREEYTVPTDTWTTGAPRTRARRTIDWRARRSSGSAGVAGVSMPTARSSGCLATVGDDLYYSGAAYPQTTTQMVAFERIDGVALVTYAPTASPTYAPCAVAAPTNGNLGSCTSALAAGAQCQPTCNTGYGVSGSMDCSATGVLAAATCMTGSWTTRKAVPAMSYWPMQGAGTYDTLMYAYISGDKYTNPANRGEFYKYVSTTDAWTSGSGPRFYAGR